MDESESTNESVLLDPQTSDLNLIVDKECLLAYPMSEEGFSSMWAGCRANYGVDSGKIAFEVNLDDYCECPDLPKDDSEAYQIRVGWSIAYTPLQLGENQFSFAYCNNGKKCTDKIFEDFGSTFEKGDSVAAYIDFETDKESIQFSFSKNGIDQGMAFVVNKNELKRKFKTEYSQDLRFLFYPHVLTKNVVFEVNFGQRVSFIGDEPFAPIKSDFLLIQKVSIEKRFCLDLPVDDKTTPEVIILVGLPHVGKTNWALNYAKNNASKFYYIIGVSTIVDKMKISAKKAQQQQQQQQQQKASEKQNSAQTSSETSEASTLDETSSTQQALNKAQHELLDKCLKCMNVLIEIASQTNRNIILDQPNVYESTRRRKLKQLEGWKRRAVVIVPEDQVYLDRMAAAEKNGKEICISLIDDMKANFTLPKPGEYIDSVEYVELNEEEAAKVIEIYNKEGLINRRNTVVNRRQKTKQAILKIIASKLGAIPPNVQPPNKLGFRMNSPANQYQPAFTNDPVRFNRFSSPGQLNTPRRGYPNQPYRMNRFSPASNPYSRPQIFGVAGFGVQQASPVATYGVNQQWPAATSTELWSQQQQQQQQHVAQFQAATVQNPWTPALPISSNINIVQNPSYTTSWNPNKNDSTKK